MLYEEFLTITNLTEDDITVWTYENVVEPMYMAAPDSIVEMIVSIQASSPR